MLFPPNELLSVGGENQGIKQEGAPLFTTDDLLLSSCIYAPSYMCKK